MVCLPSGGRVADPHIIPCRKPSFRIAPSQAGDGDRFLERRVYEQTSMTVRASALRFAHPLPYGAIVHDGGIQFVVFSRRATAMRLLLYKSVEDPDPVDIIDFDPDRNRWGDIWSVFIPEVGPGQLYHFQAAGPFDPTGGCVSTARPG